MCITCAAAARRRRAAALRLGGLVSTFDPYAYLDAAATALELPDPCKVPGWRGRKSGATARDGARRDRVSTALPRYGGHCITRKRPSFMNGALREDASVSAIAAAVCGGTVSATAVL